jgi:hypothetical protein
MIPVCMEFMHVLLQRPERNVCRAGEAGQCGRPSVSFCHERVRRLPLSGYTAAREQQPLASTIYIASI